MTCEQIVKNHLFEGELASAESFIELDVAPPGKIQFRDFLREQNFGDLEGKEFNLPEVRNHTSKLKDSGLTESEKRKLRFPGPDGESHEDVLLRAQGAWSAILKDLETLKSLNPSSETHVLIVSHGAYIREFIAAIFNHSATWTDPKILDSIRKIATHNTGIWRLSLNSEAPARVILENSVVHLDAPVFTYCPPKSLSKMAYDPAQTTITQFFQKPEN